MKLSGIERKFEYPKFHTSGEEKIWWKKVIPQVTNSEDYSLGTNHLRWV